MKTLFKATLKDFKAFIALVDQPDYRFEAEVSQDDWNKELGLFHKWAIEAGAWESGQDGVDSRISIYESGLRRQGSPLPDQAPVPEQITDWLQNLRGKLKILQGLVAGSPSDSDADDSDWSDGSGSTESRIKKYFDSVRSIISCLNSLSSFISDALAFQSRKKR